MLILKRGICERVVVFLDGQAVAQIEVNRILGNQVSLGFLAPDHVRIYRRELCHEGPAGPEIPGTPSLYLEAERRQDEPG